MMEVSLESSPTGLLQAAPRCWRLACSTAPTQHRSHPAISKEPAPHRSNRPVVFLATTSVDQLWSARPIGNTSVHPVHGLGAPGNGHGSASIRIGTSCPKGVVLRSHPFSPTPHSANQPAWLL